MVLKPGVYINANSDMAFGTTYDGELVVRIYKGGVPHTQEVLGDATVHNIDKAIEALKELKVFCS